MDRLTFEGDFCDIVQCREVPGGSFCEDGACSQRKVWERLKQYEDTGLHPDKVAELGKHLDTAILMWFEQSYGIGAGRMMELAQADKEGRVVVLPCKPRHDMVYVVHDGSVEGMVVNMFIIENGRCKVRCNGLFGGFVFCYFEAFGKTVFLTREEAEKALEGMKNG